MATKIKKWLYKACPHCIEGDLVYDEGEKAYQCIQCGYRKLLGKPLAFTRAGWIGKPAEVNDGL